MARPKKYPDPTPSADRGTLIRLSQAIVALDREIAEIRADRKEYSAEVREKAIHAQAHALALRLARMSPGKRHLFLECFDDMRVKLKLDDAQSAVDDQTDIEDVAKRKAAA